MKPSDETPQPPRRNAGLTDATNPGTGRRTRTALAPEGVTESSEATSTDASETPAEPERIGPYRVLMPIGEGGMGRVVLAHDPGLDRKIALKVLPPDDADAEGRARFLREARALARIDHRNVVRVFASGVDGDTAWMALEYIEGDPLSELLDTGPVDEVTALELAAQVARGLGAVHAMGILHRDVKPSNLLLDDDGVVRVLDFGVALLQDVGKGGGFVTQKGIAVGTPHYMAPEQARGEQLDAKVDVWGLGATLFTMLVGHPPFYTRDDESDLEILSRVLREPLPDIRTLASVREPTAKLVEELLARDAVDRIGDLDAIADALEDTADAVAAGEAPPSAPRPEPPPPPPMVGPESPITRPDGPAALERAEPNGPRRLAVAAAVIVAIGVVVTLVVMAPVWFPSTPIASAPLAPEAPTPDAIELVPLTAEPPAPTAVPSPETLTPPELERPLPSDVEGLAAVVIAEDTRQDDAIEALVEITTPPATQSLGTLASRTDAAGAAAFAAVARSTRSDRAQIFERVLNEGPQRRQLAAVAALEELRNVGAIEALGRASNQHPSKAVRKAALAARRSLFSVEGEDRPH